MPLIWMEAGLPRSWLTAPWPATHRITGEELNPSCDTLLAVVLCHDISDCRCVLLMIVFINGWCFFIFFYCHLLPLITPLPANQTAGGAAAEKSPLFSAFISGDASQQTAASTASVWMESVSARRAGRGSPATLFPVNPPPADPMVSALRVCVEVKFTALQFKENQTTAWCIFICFISKPPNSKIKKINLGLCWKWVMKWRLAKSTLYLIR